MIPMAYGWWFIVMLKGKYNRWSSSGIVTSFFIGKFSIRCLWYGHSVSRYGARSSKARKPCESNAETNSCQTRFLSGRNIAPVVITYIVSDLLAFQQQKEIHFHQKHRCIPRGYAVFGFHCFHTRKIFLRRLVTIDHIRDHGIEKTVLISIINLDPWHTHCLQLGSCSCFRFSLQRKYRYIWPMLRNRWSFPGGDGYSNER